eukprot:414060-Prymnesium_polylepis.2
MPGRGGATLGPRRRRRAHGRAPNAMPTSRRPRQGSLLGPRLYTPRLCMRLWSQVRKNMSNIGRQKCTKALIQRKLER